MLRWYEDRAAIRMAAQSSLAVIRQLRVEDMRRLFVPEMTKASTSH